MKRIITTLGLFVLTSVVAGCSWTDRQIGPNDYEISGYFDFTMKGEVVAKGLEDQGDEQFEISDGRTVKQVYDALLEEGLQPVMSDYIYV